MPSPIINVGDIDDLTHAIADLLKGAQLTQALSRLVTVKADGITVPAPLAIAIQAGEDFVEEAYPACEVIGHRVEYEDDTDEQTEIGTHTIEVRWTAIADTEELVRTYVQRLIRATRSLLKSSVLDAAHQLTPIVVTAEEYGPAFEEPGAPLKKSGRLLLSVRMITE